MRIGMVAWSFYPRVGGSATTVRQLSEALLEKGIEVDIIAPLLKKDLSETDILDIDKRIKIHWVISSSAKSYADFYSRVIFFFRFIAKIRSLSEHHIDIFHAHDFNVSFLSAIIATKKPIVAVFGADPLFELFYFKRKKCLDYKVFLERGVILFLQKMMKVFISAVSKNRPIVIGCNGYSNHIIRKYYSGPIVNIPPGINLCLYRNDATEKHREKDAILVVARFVSWKRVDLAIEVFKKIKEYKSGAKIMCIGDGPLRDYYLNKYQGLEGVYFVINSDYKEMVEFYKRASVLLVTSQYETFGISITEAMAAGLPIVASDLEVFADKLINGFNCYLIDGMEKENFLDKVRELLDNDGLREIMAKRSLDKAKDYGLGKTRDKYIELYKSLIKEDTNN